MQLIKIVGEKLDLLQTPKESAVTAVLTKLYINKTHLYMVYNNSKAYGLAIIAKIISMLEWSCRTMNQLVMCSQVEN